MIFSVQIFDELESTNTTALERARENADEGTIIVAKRQSFGRGRNNRVWSSPVGNLYCSTILRPQRDQQEWGQLSFVCALSIGSVLDDFSLEWKLKWPNDVLCRGAKVSGILLEKESNFIIAGIGINVLQVPHVEGRIVTSIWQEYTALQQQSLLIASAVERILDADQVRLALQKHLTYWYDLWQEQGFQPIRDAWLQKAVGLNNRLKVSLPSGKIVEGVMLGIDAQGVLEIKTGDDMLEKITAGDVFFD